MAALRREEEWLHREQERLEAEKAQHVRQAFSALRILHYTHVVHCITCSCYIAATSHSIDYIATKEKAYYIVWVDDPHTSVAWAIVWLLRSMLSLSHI